MKKIIRSLLLVLLIALAMAGIGLPIIMYKPDRFKTKTELVIKGKEEEDIYK